MSYFCLNIVPMITFLKEARSIIEQKSLQIEELNKKLHYTQLSLKIVQHQIDQLPRRVYGRRSEKLDLDIPEEEKICMWFLRQIRTEPRTETIWENGYET